MKGPAPPSAPQIIQAGTTLRRIPLVPEIQLYQASDPMAAWHTIEERAGVPDARGAPVADEVEAELL